MIILFLIFLVPASTVAAKLIHLYTRESYALIPWWIPAIIMGCIALFIALS